LVLKKREEETADRFFDTRKESRGDLRDASSPGPDEPEVFLDSHPPEAEENVVP